MSVFIAIRELGGRNSRKHESGAESLRKPRQDAGSEARRKLSGVNTRGGELFAPYLRMLGFGLRQLEKQIFPDRILLRSGQRRIQSGSIEFISQVFFVAFGIEAHMIRSNSGAMQRRDPRRLGLGCQIPKVSIQPGAAGPHSNGERTLATESLNRLTVPRF